MIRTLILVTAITAAALLLASIPQLADPLIRYDDYPAYFGDAADYYEKTLAEGRWLNYWWMERPALWPSWVNFLIYQLGWATFCAAAAINALGRGARLFPLSVLALLMVFSPQAFLISGWFNTLLVGIWVVAAYAVISLVVSARTSWAMMLILAPVSMLSYSTYPLLFMAITLTRADTRHSLAGLIGQVVLLAVSIALGLLLMYSLNYAAHGVFGLQLADWREPSPATDLASLKANLELMSNFFTNLFASIGFGIGWLAGLNVALAAGALGFLAAKRPGEAVYIFTGLAVSLGLMVLHSLKEGVEVPMRALIVLWVLFAIAIVRAGIVHATAERGRALAVAAFMLIALFGGQVLKHTRLLMEWQYASRALAARIPEDAGRIVIFGLVYAFEGAENARLIHPNAMSYRLRQLTGLPAISCADLQTVCAMVPPFNPAEEDDDTLLVQTDGTVFIRLPKLKEGAWRTMP